MKKYSAFSLIELSIVILIIGILIAGVTQGSRLVKKFRLRTAQTLTQSSPVNGIRDLATWYETSMESSFNAIEAQDSTAVSTWFDLNPQSPSKNNATQTLTARPTYFEDVFNSALPALRFDGTNDTLNYDASFLVNTSYTIFIVEQKRSAATFNYILSGSGGAGQNLLLGYYAPENLVIQSHFSSDLSYLLPATYTVPTPRIHTFRFDKTIGKSIWLNGIFKISDTDTQVVTSYPGAGIGNTFGTSTYSGDLAEIIIFTRALKNEERQAIEAYLSRKYAIKLS